MRRNTELVTSLEEAVDEVLGLLTGLDLTYDPELSRFRAITRSLNRALRHNALQYEWSCYNGTLDLGTLGCGGTSIRIPSKSRPRITTDDAVRLELDGVPIVWAYFLPRDAIHKYAGRKGLWCSSVDNVLQFSRPLTDLESTMSIVVPVMREPQMFRLPRGGGTPSRSVLGQDVDFAYPDLITTLASAIYAQSDPVMQPRVATLEEMYKGLMYQAIERDSSHTDTPYSNEFLLPIENGLYPDRSESVGPHSNFS